MYERGEGFGVSYPLIKRQIHSPIASGNSCLNAALTPSLVNLGSITLTPPPCVDKFWQIFQMLKSCNDSMIFIFLTSWAICLNESIYIWNSRWICPGWIFHPRKTHPFWNEWHTACCAFSGILFFVELV